MSESSFIDELRRRSLERLADLCQSGASPANFFKQPFASGQSDLLFNLVKLHAAHINHLAAFGIWQANYARRALELLYCGYGSPFEGDCGNVARAPLVEFRGAHGRDVLRHFVVQNRSAKADASVEFSCSRFKPLGGGAEFSAGRVEFRCEPLRLPPHGQGIVFMELALGPEFASGQQYVALVDVRIDSALAEHVPVRVVVE